MPKCLPLFLTDAGPINSDICHLVSPGPVPTLLQTFQNEFTAICNPLHPFPSRRALIMVFAIHCPKIQNSHSSLKIWRRFQLDPPGILYLLLLNLPILWHVTQSPLPRLLGFLCPLSSHPSQGEKKRVLFYILLN